jgi:hypothetical protein
MPGFAKATPGKGGEGSDNPHGGKRKEHFLGGDDIILSLLNLTSSTVPVINSFNSFQYEITKVMAIVIPPVNAPNIAALMPRSKGIRLAT